MASRTVRQRFTPPTGILILHDLFTLHSDRGLHRPLLANLTLESTSDGGRGGFFTIDADGQGGATHIAIPSAPIDHTLRLTANANNAPLHIEVPKTFEGTL